MSKRQETNGVRPQAAFVSHHAQQRMSQRAIQHRDVEFVLEHGEGLRDVGDGAMAISLLRSQLPSLVEGGASATRMDRLARLVVIVAADGTLVTVMNYETHFGRYMRGGSRLSCRERAAKSVRRGRGRVARDRGHR